MRSEFAGLRDRTLIGMEVWLVHEEPPLGVRKMPASVAATITPEWLGSGERSRTTPGMFASKAAQEAPALVVTNAVFELPGICDINGENVGKFADCVVPVM